MESSAEPAPGRVWATHILFFLHLAFFLVLVIGEQASWFAPLLEGVGLSDAAGFYERPWTLVTHCLFHRHYLEFILASGILLLAGAAVERELGTGRFLAFYFVTATLAGLCHLFLAGLDLLPGKLFTGSIAASSGILTAYLFLFGRARHVGGSIPFPAFYVMAAAALLAVTTALDVDARRALESTVESEQQQAYRGEELEDAQRLAIFEKIAVLRRTQPDFLGHLLGLLCGGAALLACQGLSHGVVRLRVHRDIRGLHAEVEARARVEDLLEKISREGMGSLTRQERKFLRYASRYYSARLPRIPG
jgi:membrane associated rhomboid family serine protease